MEKEIDDLSKAVLEEQIKNYAIELERSNKELEDFAYVVSHDLQEPLRAISNYLQLVERGYKEKLDDKGKDFITRAVNGARRMQDMINDLLLYSRITTRAKSYEPCSFETIVDRALNSLSAAIERSNAVIKRDSKKPMPELLCDESQVLRLFQDLIANALKFCHKPRPFIHLSSQDKGDEWLFSVKDNGIGIKPEHRERIFKIFQRLHIRGKYPGTGVGLAICRKIVERHRGKIWIESEAGKGSTFFFTIKKMNSHPGGEAA